MSVCVLISTCDKYQPVAEFSGAMIDHFWIGHPSIYYCGLSGPGPGRLPLETDPGDWMGILRDALGALRQIGYKKIYLVLDDQPPLARCHEGHLNNTLPALMDKLGAINISLNGWGQGRLSNGEILDDSYYCIERVARDFVWKFQLHPALWEIESLMVVLDTAMDGLAPHERTPWMFERKTGGRNSGLPERLTERSYRICGLRMSASRTRVWLVRVERFLAAVAAFGIGRMFGDRARSRFDGAMRFITRYYEGPYPLLWSGVLTKGELNSDMVRRLRTHGPRYCLDALLKQCKAGV